MLKIRHQTERGLSKTDWLTSYHSFSFNEYLDSKWHHFHDLRVINEDWIAAKTGFGMHPHQDMEILTYVLKGTLSHEDSLGHVSELRTGEWQRMRAGTGIVHSEWNHGAETCHLFQIWIRPDNTGLKPGYEQKPFERIVNQWQTIAKPTPDLDTLLIHQNVMVKRYIATETQTLDLDTTNQALYLQMVQGKMHIGGVDIDGSDAVCIESETNLKLTLQKDTEIIAFIFA